jgi:rubrerythrin
MKRIKRLLFCAVVSCLMAGTVAAAEAKAPAKATTLENLQAAYNGESNASARYAAFATKADAEGYLGAGAMFRATSKSESIHAARHAKVIEALGAVPKSDIKAADVKSTKENLKAAIAGENYEFQKMYPAFIKQAKADKNAEAEMSFKDAMTVEKTHSKLYSQALNNLQNWKAVKTFIVCQNCGFVTSDLGVKPCSVCSFPRSQFVEVQ